MNDVLAFESDWPDAPFAAHRLTLAAEQLDARGLLHAASWAQQLAISAWNSESHHQLQEERADVEFGLGDGDGDENRVPAPPRQGRGAKSDGQYQHPTDSDFKAPAPTASTPARHPSPNFSSRASTSSIFVPPAPRRPRVHFDGSAPQSKVESAGAPTATGIGSRAGPGATEAHPRTRPPPPLSTAAPSFSVAHPTTISPSRALYSPAPDAIFRAARLCFSLAQLERCVELLSRSTGTGKESPCHTFLRLYSKFLIAERAQADAESILPRVPNHPSAAGTAATGLMGVGGTAGAGGLAGMPSPSAAARPATLELLAELVRPNDPYLLYLKAVLLRRLHHFPEAADCLIRSIREFPYNWSAWLELSTCLGPDTFELSDVVDWLPQSFMTSLFFEYHLRTTHSRVIDEEEDVPSLTRIGTGMVTGSGNAQRQELLLHLFPCSTHILLARALSAHAQMHHATAAQLFAQVLELDPYCTEGLAEYSNSLHLLRDRAALALLASKFASMASGNAQVCVLIGNYHNSRGDRARAVAAFQRALRLDLGCLMAWVLLGHEYVELKNPTAAAEMYRRALEVDRGDFRSWHGLGQVYELSEAWTYAVYYYSRAAHVRPYDPRIWLALGACYDKLGRWREALQAYKRQLACHPDLEETVAGIERIIRLLERNRSEIVSSYNSQDHVYPKSGSGILPRSSTSGSASASAAVHHGISSQGAQSKERIALRDEDPMLWHIRLVTLVDAHLFPRTTSQRNPHSQRHQRQTGQRRFARSKPQGPRSRQLQTPTISTGPDGIQQMGETDGIEESGSHQLTDEELEEDQERAKGTNVDEDQDSDLSLESESGSYSVPAPATGSMGAGLDPNDLSAWGALAGGLARFAPSYLHAARYELGLPQDEASDPGLPTGVLADQGIDASPAAMKIGKMKGSGYLGVNAAGDRALAHEYLQKVVLAGTSLTDEAEELLKRVRMGQN